jgi:hypothetical protein
MPINKRNRRELKQYFVKNAIPTESNFGELIDGVLNQRDDGIGKLLDGDPLSIEAVGDATSQKKLLQLYNSFGDSEPAWVLSLQPRQNPADASSARAGFSISDSAGNSRLFVERITGNIGVGTIGPLEAAVHIDRGATADLALMLSSSGRGWGSGLQLRSTTAGSEKTFGIYTGSGALHFHDVDASTDRLRITREGTVQVIGALQTGQWVSGGETKTGWCLGRGATNEDEWLRLTTTAHGGTYHDFAVNSFWAAGAKRFDLAEVTAVHPGEQLEQGDVVVIDREDGTRVRRSTRPHDRAVYGIVSSYHQAAMVIGGFGGPEEMMQATDKLPIALVGRARVKVSGEAGPICVGDLLTTSSSPGRAMRCVDPAAHPGAIAAKALEPFSGDAGTILALVTLQ